MSARQRLRVLLFAATIFRDVSDFAVPIGKVRRRRGPPPLPAVDTHQVWQGLTSIGEKKISGATSKLWAVAAVV